MFKFSGYKYFILSFLAGSFIFISCHSSTDNSSVNKPEAKNLTAIELFSSSLHSVPLPFKDTCFDTVAVQHIKLPDSLPKFKTFGQIIGKINETSDYIAILFSKSGDIQLPILRTFNHNGELISSLRLYLGDCCGENEDCSGVSTVSISKDLHITLKDSTQTFERDKKKFDKKSNIKIKVKDEIYRISDKGEIEKVSTPNS